MAEKLIDDCEKSQQIGRGLEISAYTKCNLIMLKIFQFQGVSAETEEMPNWLAMLIKSSKQPIPAICTVSIERFLNLLQFLDLTRTQGGGRGPKAQRCVRGMLHEGGSEGSGRRATRGASSPGTGAPAAETVLCSRGSLAMPASTGG